jgi:WD40 repeat protein
LFTAPAEFSTDGSVVVTMRAGGKIDLWDVATHKYLMTITEANFKVSSAVVGPGGSEVAVLGGSDGRQVAVWETPLSSPKSPPANAKA